MIRRGNILLVGPLAEAEENLTELGMNLFTSLMLADSVERLEAAEKEYAIACDSDDVDDVKNKELNLKACETTMQISIAMIANEEEIVQ